MTDQQLITTFYEAFANQDAEGMIACYADDIAFQDPAFGRLHGEDAKDMWRMLLSKKDAAPEVRLVDVSDDGTSADWWARYNYGPKRRPVINEISASFVIKNGKITEHTDYFDLWKWSRQALGLPGLLMGWSPFMRSKVQETTREMLGRFQGRK
jgi:ketosteroid isomerase-like protein